MVVWAMTVVLSDKKRIINNKSFMQLILMQRFDERGEEQNNAY